MNRIVFISGASSGIGKSCAFEFAAHGDHLILCGRRSSRLENIKNEIQLKYQVKIHILSFDVRNSVEVENAINSIPVDFFNIDVLINNAGLSLGLDPINSGNLEDWNTMIDTNVKGLLYVSKFIIPRMMERKSGHIINIGSIAGKETYLNGNVYCASKHAVDSITKAMRIDLLEHGIKVSAINPGAVETEFSIVRFKGDETRAKKVYDGFKPLTPQDIAETIYFVASRPAHVNINDLLIMPTAQANASTILRIEN